MVHALRFDEHIRTAERLAQEITGVKIPMDYVWLTTVTVDNVVAEDTTEDDMFLPALEEPDPQETVIEDLLEELDDHNNVNELNGLREPFNGQNSEAMNDPVPFDGGDKEPENRAGTSQAMDDMLVKPSPQNPKLSDDSDFDVKMVGDITALEKVHVKAGGIHFNWDNSERTIMKPQTQNPKNPADPDSDIEVVGDITIETVHATAAANELCITWIEPIVRSMSIVLDAAHRILDNHSLGQWTTRDTGTALPGSYDP